MGTQVTEPTEVGLMVAACRDSSAMRDVNKSMRRMSGSFALADPIAFFCECELPSCYSAVWMSAEGFDATVTNGATWLLTETHNASVSHRPEAASADEPAVPALDEPAGGETHAC